MMTTGLAMTMTLAKVSGVGKINNRRNNLEFGFLVGPFVSEKAANDYFLRRGLKRVDDGLYRSDAPLTIRTGINTIVVPATHLEVALVKVFDLENLSIGKD